MKSMKTIYKDNEAKIKFAGRVAGIAVVGLGAAAVVVLVRNRVNLKTAKDLIGKDVISWKPNGSLVDLERVKEVLELNKDNSLMYAIFREGPDSNAYSIIQLNGSKLIG